ncbi:hypothetical protein DPMN_135863 [Dreissena polymorpha]|uniref:Uncharacterized protein n=1 Tax=Dreissena polymorpha TaxID=45954 RepID=A0A9D4FYK6_DREPO|nr:hypothetical protein DPMN_135863 [Dreissena polymorpha]
MLNRQLITDDYNKFFVCLRAVVARLACLSDILVAKCGKKHYGGIVNHAEYFFTDEPLTWDRTSSAAYAYLSMMTSLFAVLFVLILS